MPPVDEQVADEQAVEEPAFEEQAVEERSGEDRESASRVSRRRFRTRILAFLLLAVAIIATFLVLDADDTARTLVRWVDALGWWAVPVFVGLHSVAVVLLLPGAIFPLMAGFLFGPFGGTIYSTLGKTLGAVGAFCIARFLIAGHRRSLWLGRVRRRHPGLASLEVGLVRGGWRSLALIRLIPAIPFKVSSYLLGWSQLRLRDFVLGTFLGSIPFSITNAYLGSMAGNLSALGVAPAPRTRLGWSLYLGAAALALAAALWAIVAARRIVREAG